WSKGVITCAPTTSRSSPCRCWLTGCSFAAKRSRISSARRACSRRFSRTYEFPCECAVVAVRALGGEPSSPRSRRRVVERVDLPVSQLAAHARRLVLSRRDHRHRSGGAPHRPQPLL